jgi:hypothetical protein
VHACGFPILSRRGRTRIVHITHTGGRDFSAKHIFPPLNRSALAVRQKKN